MPENTEIIKPQKKEKQSKQKKINDMSLFIKLDNNSFIDINSEFKWLSNSITEMQKKFIFFYAYPFNNGSRGKGAECARKAGYAIKSAKITAVQLLKNQLIYTELKNIQSQINEKLTKTNLKNKINEIISQKIKRTQINVCDYYEVERETTEDGIEFSRGMIKPIKELTDEQKELIEDVEFVGQRGIVHYKLPNKRESENELIKIYKELYAKEEENKNDFDVETTVDMIKENLKIKTKIIKRNSEITELSDLKENSENANKEIED